MAQPGRGCVAAALSTVDKVSGEGGGAQPRYIAAGVRNGWR